MQNQQIVDLVNGEDKIKYFKMIKSAVYINNSFIVQYEAQEMFLIEGTKIFLVQHLMR